MRLPKDLNDVPKDLKDAPKAKTVAAQGNLQDQLVIFFNLYNAAKDELRERIPFGLIAIMANYSFDPSPQEFVKQNLKDPDLIARYCLRLLEEKEQNGVSCALNLLDPSERGSLLKFLFENYPLLGVYFAEYSEWKDTMQGTIREELLKKYNSMTDIVDSTIETFTVKKAGQLLPNALVHALKIKFLMQFQYWEHTGLTHGTPIDLRWAQQLNTLIKLSSLHLNFHHVRIYGLSFESIDFSTLDFTGVIIEKSRFIGCNFTRSEFNRAVFDSSVFKNADFTQAQLLEIIIWQVLFRNCIFNQA